jgi:hypothetical protein
MLWLPALKERVANVATPLLKVAVPKLVLPSLKVMVPVTALDETVAVKVAIAPENDGFDRDVMTVVVAMVPTDTLTVPIIAL